MPLARLCAGKRILSPYIFRDMKKVRHLPFVWGEIGERVRDERKRRKIDNFSCLVGLEIGKRESKSVGPIEFWSLSRWAKKYKEGEFSFFTLHLYPSSNFAELFFFSHILYLREQCLRATRASGHTYYLFPFIYYRIFTYNLFCS